MRESIAEFFFPPPAHNRLELPSGTSLEQEVGRLVYRSAANQREFTPKDLSSGDSLLTVNGPTAFGWSCLKGLGRNENNHSPSLTGIVSGPGSFWIQSSSWQGVLSKCYLIISFKPRAIERESLGRWGFRLWDHTRQSPLTAQDLPRATLSLKRRAVGKQQQLSQSDWCAMKESRNTTVDTIAKQAYVYFFFSD